MSRPIGPRVIFKDDRDSSTWGCKLYGAHFRPEMSIIVWAFAATAPEELAGIHFTEGHRDIRDERDLHEELRALDLGLNYPEWSHRSEDERRLHARAWAKRAGELLGPDYQVVVHGAGFNLHIHIELDPR